jgi:monofunctional glycosyltransferase
VSVPRKLLWIAPLALGCGYLVYEAATWPEVAALAVRNPETTAFIERYRDRARGEPAWRWVPYASISAELKRAVLVAEDIEFFSHDGFSRTEINNAMRAAMEDKEMPRGASTVTQQVAKNLWLSPSRNPLRKVKEALLTRQLEKSLPKRRILEIYLNVAEFGPGVYGAEAAARRYFGVPASGLSSRQAAELVAGLSRPSSWHPGVATRGYLRRVASIETRMAKAGWLAKEI